jgi:hypothetical protein
MLWWQFAIAFARFALKRWMSSDKVPQATITLSVFCAALPAVLLASWPSSEELMLGSAAGLVAVGGHEGLKKLGVQLLTPFLGTEAAQGVLELVLGKAPIAEPKPPSIRMAKAAAAVNLAETVRVKLDKEPPEEPPPP